MSERILRALMRLFAIVARIDDNGTESSGNGRDIVLSFLKERLPSRLVDEYLALFEEFIALHRRPKGKGGQVRAKRIAGNSVKVLHICTEINKELSHGQKIIVLVRLLEFLFAHDDITEQEIEFVDTVAEVFNIQSVEYRLIKAFVSNHREDLITSSEVLFVTADEEDSEKYKNHFTLEGIDDDIEIARVASANLFFLKYRGSYSIQINGQPLSSDRIQLFNQGASLRSSLTQPLYYSDVVSTFLDQSKVERLTFKADNIQFKFRNGNNGLHPMAISEESGRLIGVMGASGSGKSTLLNVLNGNLTPTEGQVTINGVDIHHEKEKIEGVIGYVAQDDLLIEELSVFQNLYYNAKLCFGKLSKEEITELVNKMLLTLGLADTAELKVGNPLEKTISGGQRKRLNIALELIREPSVLFVDEPTSGLSSRDSENIMDLLKELALKGKLIFVVIHQPSSDIFKMFDKLVILDTGGYPVYYGNPVDSVIYFKKVINHINSNESECPRCGNVNPEQIFNIIEARVVDEYGNQTEQRKVSPAEWNSYYVDSIGNKIIQREEESNPPKSTFDIPSLWKQFKVFMTRDVLSKVTNRQYVLINMLEAPALAFILAFFMRYFMPMVQGSDYVFRENENIPAYLFISVIVALFIGLTVASEEIVRDRKIRKREAFLNLSKNSYLFSKISIMIGLSAIQMALYILVGNTILEIKGMNFYHWTVLFSTCVFANLLGLNISATFNSAKVIYILIPILIIPQMLFSGIIVKFDKLNPMFASQSSVPWIGNIMTSRWAYEAMAVAQFKWNEYERIFYPFDKRKKFANWKKDYWVTELKNKVINVERYSEEAGSGEKLERELEVIRHELGKENEFLKGIRFEKVDQLRAELLTNDLIEELNDYLSLVEEHYKQVYLKAEREKEDLLQKMTSTPESKSDYIHLLNNYKNDNLERFATNRNDLNYIIEHKGKLIQKKDLIYLEPYHSSFFDAHFYAPSKQLFGRFIDTFEANLMVIWGMTILLCISLFGDVFPRVANGLEKVGGYLKR